MLKALKLNRQSLSHLQQELPLHREGDQRQSKKTGEGSTKSDDERDELRRAC